MVNGLKGQASPTAATLRFSNERNKYLQHCASLQYQFFKLQIKVLISHWLCFYSTRYLDFKCSQKIFKHHVWDSMPLPNTARNCSHPKALHASTVKKYLYQSYNYFHLFQNKLSEFTDGYSFNLESSNEDFSLSTKQQQKDNN